MVSTLDSWTHISPSVINTRNELSPSSTKATGKEALDIGFKIENHLKKDFSTLWKTPFGPKMKMESFWPRKQEDSNSREENTRKGKEKEKDDGTTAVSSRTKDTVKENTEKEKEKEKDFTVKMEYGMNLLIPRRQLLILARASQKVKENQKANQNQKEKVMEMAKEPKVPMPILPTNRQLHPRQRISQLIKHGMPPIGIGILTTAGKAAGMNMMDTSHMMITTQQKSAFW